jgi:hypothetical protein
MGQELQSQLWNCQSVVHNILITLQIHLLHEYIFELSIKSSGSKSSPILDSCIQTLPSLVSEWIIECKAKPQGGSIPKIRGLGQGGSRVQPCILGMFSACGLYK